MLLLSAENALQGAPRPYSPLQTRPSVATSSILTTYSRLENGKYFSYQTNCFVVPAARAAPVAAPDRLNISGVVASNRISLHVCNTLMYCFLQPMTTSTNVRLLPTKLTLNTFNEGVPGVFVLAYLHESDDDVVNLKTSMSFRL